jgi:hypothetical protein
MPTRYRITIRADERRGFYATSGAVAVTAANPMLAAASALLAKGSDPGDKLTGVFEGATISAVSLAAIVKPRRIPRIDLRPSERNA